ncbi:helix-turn-helix domain-containing protein [Paenibacillus pabuli]
MSHATTQKSAILPHKIHRCYGLSPYEKLILVDIVAYMSDQSQCYPTIEMIARNLGCSSKSVERHIAKLAVKKLILVSHSKNNTYYLPNYLHVHPYLLVSEKTHEFIGGVEAMENGKVDGRVVRGSSSNGLEFEGYIDETTGKVTNVFPIVPRNE